MSYTRCLSHSKLPCRTSQKGTRRRENSFRRNGHYRILLLGRDRKQVRGIDSHRMLYSPFLSTDTSSRSIDWVHLNLILQPTPVYPISRQIKGPRELQAYGNWNLEALPGAQHAGQSIRDEKGQGGDTGDERNKTDVKKMCRACYKTRRKKGSHCPGLISAASGV
jgi:hypothetical protein